MTQTWGGRRANRAALDHVRAMGHRNNTPCIICDGTIDYRLRYPDPMSCSVQHIHSRHHRPDLRWDPTTGHRLHGAPRPRRHRRRLRRLLAGDRHTGPQMPHLRRHCPPRHQTLVQQTACRRPGSPA